VDGISKLHRISRHSSQLDKESCFVFLKAFLKSIHTRSELPIARWLFLEIKRRKEERRKEVKNENMATPTNQAAWLIKADTPLKVDAAPLPSAGPGELVVKNAAIAINPLDCHMQDSGIFVQQWPAIFGCDVAGEVYEVGPDTQRFKKGDRVIG
jgi:hypothetical protein